jgi:hypothetical protein
MIPINLVFQKSDVRYEIKTELKLRYLLSDMKYWLENLAWSVRKRTIQLLDRFLLSDSTGWSGIWWRLKRSSTNWSFFSKWSWNWFRCNPSPQTSLSRLLCVQISFSVLSFDLDFRSGYLCPVSRLDSGSVIRTRIRIRNSFVSRIWT